MFISTLERTYLEGKIAGRLEAKLKAKVESKLEAKLEGKIEAQKDAILKFLHIRFKKVPDLILQAVDLYSDPVVLDSLFDRAITCESLTDFIRDLVNI
ncbi:MAG: hypothetical protein LBB88_03790 [Planctomycetaceae bacterium]|jgi:hypothetical protein|nr:hypothetical protein [Planctomycetaceae bacterium]